ncbi:MAG: ABC transporter permease [Planctomycetota bacterium]|nr:ABC transporter permease [Planctomycetota bacterium]
MANGNTYDRAAGLILSPLVSLAVATGVATLVVIALGHSPVKVVQTIHDGVSRSPLGVWMDISDILYRSTPLILAGLAVALAFHAGLINIGGQGQFVVGAFICALVGERYWAGLSYPLILFAAGGAFFGGVLWAYLPAFMRARRGAHEVITTIMMNFIAISATAYMLSVYFHAGGNIPQTAPVIDAVRLPRLGRLFSFVPAQSPLNVAFFVAIAAVIIVSYLLWRTKFGFELRAVGSNADAAAAAGIDCARTRERVLMLSGGLMGLAAINLVLGTDYAFCQENAIDHGLIGFAGIAVALMAQSHPIAVVPAAVFFGALGRLEFLLKLHTDIPKDIVTILQAVVIMCIIVCNEIFRRRMK